MMLLLMKAFKKEKTKNICVEAKSWILNRLPRTLDPDKPKD
jgi:hypothetical protein